jgi:RTX calcium-binding nonapeptide repeat (4 copies)
MTAVGFSRRTRVLIGASALAIGVGAAVPAVLGNAGAKSDRDGLAARLLRLDPGARLGANTQVATAARARLSGVRGRRNFMIGLGARQQIVGGASHDQLGAHGATGVRIHGAHGHDLIHGGQGHQRLHGGTGHDFIHGGHGHDRIHAGHGRDRIHAGHGHDMIRAGHGRDRIHAGHGHDLIRGGHGHDRIHGGAGRDRLMGGPGRDRLIDRQGATVAVPGPGRNHVDVADGNRDRVACAAGSTNRIVVDRGDRLHPTCRAASASSVSYRRPPNGAGAQPPDAPAAHAAQSISGDGSNDNPYVAECTEPQYVICNTPLFTARSLTGLWANEYVPAYQCPPSHPFLYDENYAPAGTALPQGVGVLGLGPIGVSITGVRMKRVTVNEITSIYTIGTYTGWPSSSATNWEIDTNSYQVQLACTSDTDYAVFTGYV